MKTFCQRNAELGLASDRAPHQPRQSQSSASNVHHLWVEAVILLIWDQFYSSVMGIYVGAVFPAASEGGFDLEEIKTESATITVYPTLCSPLNVILNKAD